MTMVGPRVTQVPSGTRVQQAPAPYAAYETDWTTTITSLMQAILPLLVVMMMFKMLTPMLEGMTR